MMTTLGDVRHLEGYIERFSNSNGIGSKVYSSALGILAYAKSFREISRVSLQNGNNAGVPDNLNPELNERLVEESIRASQDTLRNTTQERIRKSDVARNITISAIGFLLPIVGLLQLVNKKDLIDVEPSTNLILVAKWLVQNPFVSISVIIALYITATFLKGIVDIGNWRVARRLLIWLQPFKLGISVAIVFLLAMTILNYTFKFVFSLSFAGVAWERIMLAINFIIHFFQLGR